jgi:hypothetical protein
MNDAEITESFMSEAYSFQEAVHAFGKVIEHIDKAYKAGEFLDWPTVILSTLLQTTAISLYQLLPKGDQQLGGIIDRRSIASLVRNLVDTHDVLDLLCDVSQPAEVFSLHRDIMGYYLSGRLHKTHDDGAASNFSGRMRHTQQWYWNNIRKTLPDEARRNGIKSGQSLFYLTRNERLVKTCGEHATFVGKILSDLSSYIHSIPPALWLKRVEEAFTDNTQTRGILAVWLRIANFYFARSVNIAITSVAVNTDDFLRKYIEQNRTVFVT